MSIRRSLAVAGVVVGITGSSIVGASPAHASTTWGAFTHNCGNVTCSLYLSRSATKEIYDRWIEGAALEAGIQGACSYIPHLVAQLVCRGAALTTGGILAHTFDEAVNDHPPKGACFKITYLKSSINVIKAPTMIPTWVSTNNGTYCKD